MRRGGAVGGRERPLAAVGLVEPRRRPLCCWHGRDSVHPLSLRNAAPLHLRRHAHERMRARVRSCLAAPARLSSPAAALANLAPAPHPELQECSVVHGGMQGGVELAADAQHGREAAAAAATGGGGGAASDRSKFRVSRQACLSAQSTRLGDTRSRRADAAVCAAPWPAAALTTPDRLPPPLPQHAAVGPGQTARMLQFFSTREPACRGSASFEKRLPPTIPGVAPLHVHARR
jgi:hypothetical protein